MKRLGYVMVLVVMIMSLLSWGVLAGELPESVRKQSRKGAKESEEWQQHDSSGAVKFLQVQHTAAASPTDAAAKLDGSIGERLVEMKVDDPAIAGDMATWTVENNGPGVVWVVASSDDSVTDAIEIQPEGNAELDVKLMDGYCYLVVDSDGNDETTVSLKAAIGEHAAKTVRGKDMAVAWF